MEEAPFPSHIHLNTPECDEFTQQLIQEFRAKLEDHEHYEELKDWLTDEQLHRFLIARNKNLKKSHDLILEALKWRISRKPHLIEAQPGWEALMSKESETGKIYCSGNDRWGRPVIVFDNTVQNTNVVDNQMKFLAWNLEFAIRQMPSNIDKYLIFMHLNAFSFFNCPPLQSTSETIHMLCNCFPERLGHCVAYLPPFIFKTFFNGVKHFIDPKTANKLIFITGDVSDGSENDLLMKNIIGDNWKLLTGADQPVYAPGCSPGYRHDQYWPSVMERIAKEKEDSASTEDISN